MLVLDSSNKIGKKILMSGGGRCNFTNLSVEPEHFLSANPHFCISALSRYSQWDFIALVEKHRIPYHERLHGQLFCNDSAKDILAMLVYECEQVGVEIRTHSVVQSVLVNDQTGSRFTLVTQKERFDTDSLVVATGGLSIPTLGSSGYGYELARQFGHQVLATRAGLVPFTFSDHIKPVTERLSGLAVASQVAAASARFTENILFTHRGLSGPAVLQASNYWQLGDSVSINLLPEQDMQSCLRELKRSHPRSLLRTVLADYLAKALVLELQTLLWPTLSEKPLADIPDNQLDALAEALHAWTVKPSGTEGYRTAEVTLGGVDTRELSSQTMESRVQAGLFFIGEVVDVTGWLGGYNFQWAWSSGYAAGLVV